MTLLIFVQRPHQYRSVRKLAFKTSCIERPRSTLPDQHSRPQCALFGIDAPHSPFRTSWMEESDYSTRLKRSY